MNQLPMHTSPCLCILHTPNKRFFGLEIREGGDIRLLITLVPKILYSRFFMRWLNNFGDFYWILIFWFIKLSVNIFQLLFIFYRGNFVYYHWGCTDQFISHCLIPLDSWIKIHTNFIHNKPIESNHMIIIFQSYYLI